MAVSLLRMGCAGVLLMASAAAPVSTGAWSEARANQEALAPANDTVPSDLRPLLAQPQSEMRLVAQRYNADRNTLNGNYDGGRGFGRGGGRGQGGRGASTPAPPPSSAVAPPPVSMSPNRIARLKRFDMNWQAALGKLDVSKL